MICIVILFGYANLANAQNGIPFVAIERATAMYKYSRSNSSQSTINAILTHGEVRVALQY